MSQLAGYFRSGSQKNVWLILVGFSESVRTQFVYRGQIGRTAFTH